MKKTERKKRLAKALELTLDSALSHASYTFDDRKKCNVKGHKKELGDPKFHRKCVKEYLLIAEAILYEQERL